MLLDFLAAVVLTAIVVSPVVGVWALQALKRRRIAGAFTGELDAASQQELEIDVFTEGE